MPKISVIISTYERSEMLRECIDSFFRQTFRDFELCICNDGGAISNIQNDPRIKYVNIEHTESSSAPRNAALKLADGEYIMVFDDDDRAESTLIEKCVKTLDENPDIDCVYTDYYDFNKDGRWQQRTTQYDHDLQKLLVKEYMPHGGSTWRKNKFPGYDEYFKSAEDWDLFLTAAENGLRFKHISECLWNHRVGHKQEKGTPKQDFYIKEVIKKHAKFRKD